MGGKKRKKQKGEKKKKLGDDKISNSGRLVLKNTYLHKSRYIAFKNHATF